jgi:SNF2 family DNA or RNA helicase
MKHQVADLRFCLSRYAAGNFSEMGAGKTLPTALAALGLMQDGHADCVVALMPDSIFGEWENTLKQLIDTRIRPYFFLGPNRSSELALNHPFVVTTYQTFLNEYLLTKKTAKNNQTPKGTWVNKQSLFYKLGKSKRVILIVDEASCLRNLKAKRTKGIEHFALELAKFKYLLTGNPAPNGAYNLYPFLRILAPGAYPTERYFIEQHCVVQGTTSTNEPLIVAYKNLEPLKELISNVSVRHLKAECMDLPDKMYNVKELELPTWHRSVYDEAVKNGFIELPSGKMLDMSNVFSLITRLRQLSSNPDLMGLRSGVHKVQQLKQDLNEIGTNDGHKVVVFSCYVNSGYAILKAAKELGWNTAQVFDTNKIDKRAEIKRFQTDPNCNLIVVNPQAGGLGVNLSMANWNIFYEYDYNLDTHDQALERSHRKGLVGPLTIIYYVTLDTIEPGILEALRGKKHLSAELLRDPVHLRDFLQYGKGFYTEDATKAMAKELALGFEI